MIIKKGFRNEECTNKCAFVMITPDMNILELKLLIIRKMFIHSNRNLISDIKITRDDTNYFDKKIHYQNSYQIFSRIDKNYIFFEVSRDKLHIDVYDKKEKHDLFFPLALQNNYHDLINHIFKK